jgi:hypothetical protein
MMSVVFLTDIVLFKHHFWTYPNNNNFSSSKMSGKKERKKERNVDYIFGPRYKGHHSHELLGYRKFSFSL